MTVYQCCVKSVFMLACIHGNGHLTSTGSSSFRILLFVAVRRRLGKEQTHGLQNVDEDQISARQFKCNETRQLEGKPTLADQKDEDTTGTLYLYSLLDLLELLCSARLVGWLCV